MNKLQNLSCLVMITFITGINTCAAYEKMTPPSYSPVEIYACDFRKGKSMSDLNRVAKKWNDWLDKTGGTKYDAYTLTPIYFSEEIKFDVAWLGVYEDGAAMGKGMNHWITNGGKLAEEFNRVLRCDTVVNYAALTVHAPEQRGTTDTLQFSNCRIKKNRTSKEAVEAIRSWGEYRSTKGVALSSWVLFPTYGESSKADFDFKWATGFSSYDNWGTAYDQYSNGGGYRKYRKIVEPVIECDNPRLYDVTTVRISE